MKSVPLQNLKTDCHWRARCDFPHGQLADVRARQDVLLAREAQIRAAAIELVAEARAAMQKAAPVYLGLVRDTSRAALRWRLRPGAGPGKSHHKRIRVDAGILEQTDPEARALLLHFEAIRTEVDHEAQLVRYEIDGRERLLAEIDNVRQLKKRLPAAGQVD